MTLYIYIIEEKEARKETEIESENTKAQKVK